jgi:hypothetical protein
LQNWSKGYKNPINCRQYEKMRDTVKKQLPFLFYLDACRGPAEIPLAGKLGQPRLAIDLGLWAI